MYNGLILSGLPGSGKSTLAKRISEIYRWQLLAIGDMFRDEWKRDHPNKDISFEEYWRRVSLDKNREVNEQAKELFKKGNIVAESRYSAIYCKELPILRIFVYADLETRAERAVGSSKYPDMSKERIKGILLQREEDEVRVGRELFDFDYRSPENYHKILDSVKLGIDQEVEILKKLLNELRNRSKLRRI